MDQLEYGTRYLAGGLVVSWRSQLEFKIVDGQFQLGTGTADLKPGFTFISRPEKRFDCSISPGTFASRNGQSFSMPHLRYRSFPMQGIVSDGEVVLKPYIEYPGNYYAILYQCSTADEVGLIWKESAPRISRELGKQQSMQVEELPGEYIVRVKEVRNIHPGPELKLPLQDGLHWSLSEDFGLRKLSYRLQKLTTEESR